MTSADGPVSLTEQQLLWSVTEAARNLFGAAAASVFLLDKETGELVFEAVSGEGDGHLVGTRFPPGTGIAGWVASCGQPMLVDEVGDDAHHRRTASCHRNARGSPVRHDSERTLSAALPAVPGGQARPPARAGPASSTAGRRACPGPGNGPR